MMEKPRAIKLASIRKRTKERKKTNIRILL